MLPGLRDRLLLLSNAFAVLVPVFFTVITGIALAQEVSEKAAEADKELIDYLSSNLWDLLTSIGLLFFGFLISSFAASISMYKAYVTNQREIEIRRAFGAGIWHGYAVNFLDRVADSIKDRAGGTPKIVIASPSYEIIHLLDFRRIVNQQLPATFDAKNFDMISQYGEGDPAWFRQVFIISNKNKSVTTRDPDPVFFDLPTTFVSFEGAIKAIADKRQVYVSDSKKSEYFNLMKKDFFEEALKWSRISGVKIVIVDVFSGDVEEFANKIIRNI
jgi:hypothetical protein